MSQNRSQQFAQHAHFNMPMGMEALGQPPFATPITQQVQQDIGTHSGRSNTYTADQRPHGFHSTQSSPALIPPAYFEQSLRGSGQSTSSNNSTNVKRSSLPSLKSEERDSSQASEQHELRNRQNSPISVQRSVSVPTTISGQWTTGRYGKLPKRRAASEGQSEGRHQETGALSGSSETFGTEERPLQINLSQGQTGNSTASIDREHSLRDLMEHDEQHYQQNAPQGNLAVPTRLPALNYPVEINPTSLIRQESTSDVDPLRSHSVPTNMGHLAEIHYIGPFSEGVGEQDRTSDSVIMPSMNLHQTPSPRCGFDSVQPPLQPPLVHHQQPESAESSLATQNQEPGDHFSMSSVSSVRPLSDQGRQNHQRLS